MADTYASTARFTREDFTDPMAGAPLVKVTDTVSGMLVAILSPDDFAAQYELVTDE